MTRFLQIIIAYFQIWDKNGEQVATRFRTKKGSAYLKQMRLYTSVHE